MAKLVGEVAVIAANYRIPDTCTEQFPKPCAWNSCENVSRFLKEQSDLKRTGDIHLLAIVFSHSSPLVSCMMYLFFHGAKTSKQINKKVLLYRVVKEVSYMFCPEETHFKHSGIVDKVKQWKRMCNANTKSKHIAKS